jgi:hypothetical protein
MGETDSPPGFGAGVGAGAAIGDRQSDTSLLWLLDGQLEVIVPKLTGLSSDDYTALLSGRSREELLREFGAE